MTLKETWIIPHEAVKNSGWMFLKNIKTDFIICFC